jgi:hypothetical protein
MSVHRVRCARLRVDQIGTDQVGRLGRDRVESRVGRASVAAGDHANIPRDKMSKAQADLALPFVVLSNPPTSPTRRQRHATLPYEGIYRLTVSLLRPLGWHAPCLLSRV